MEENIKYDTDKINYALTASGIIDKIKTLPNKEKSVLTREFDDNGIILSGGEIQKIAISRMFAKNNSIAILDEPSSALDPISEYKLFQNMMEVCSGKTVIFISHRLSSVIMADKILMMENGKIIEQGSHNELMKLKGKYADMFNKQAEKYLEENECEIAI